MSAPISPLPTTSRAPSGGDKAMAQGRKSGGACWRPSRHAPLLVSTLSLTADPALLRRPPDQAVSKGERAHDSDDRPSTDEEPGELRHDRSRSAVGEDREWPADEAPHQHKGHHATHQLHRDETLHDCDEKHVACAKQQTGNTEDPGEAVDTAHERHPGHETGDWHEEQDAGESLMSHLVGHSRCYDARIEPRPNPLTTMPNACGPRSTPTNCLSRSGTAT